MGLPHLSHFSVLTKQSLYYCIVLLLPNIIAINDDHMAYIQTLYMQFQGKIDLKLTIFTIESV